eukprot:1156454-Pelagomonas_calceolata.AAC.2
MCFAALNYSSDSTGPAMLASMRVASPLVRFAILNCSLDSPGTVTPASVRVTSPLQYQQLLQSAGDQLAAALQVLHSWVYACTCKRSSEECGACLGAHVLPLLIVCLQTPCTWGPKCARIAVVTINYAHIFHQCNTAAPVCARCLQTACAWGYWCARIAAVTSWCLGAWRQAWC